MTKETIINELCKRGYNVEPMDVVKNGVTLQGIIFKEESVNPIIYVDEFLKRNDSELNEITKFIIDIYEDSVDKTFDVSHISEWDYVKTRLQLCLQKKSDENIVKRDFLDLEQYIRVIVDSDRHGNSSFKVQPHFLNVWGITEDILFNASWDCTKPKLIKRDMSEIMAEMMGVSIEEIELMVGNEHQIVLSNKKGLNGSIAMCDTWLLSEIANKYEMDLVILPSSIHEIIVVPTTDKSLLNYNRMVREVNSEQVLPEEVLSNHAYRFERETMKITF